MRTGDADLVGALVALDKAKDGRVSYTEFKVYDCDECIRFV